MTSIEPGVTSHWLPSAVPFRMASMAIRPPAPGLLSTITVSATTPRRKSARRRLTASIAPPAGKPATSLVTLGNRSWAGTGHVDARPAPAMPCSTTRLFTECMGDSLAQKLWRRPTMTPDCPRPAAGPTGVGSPAVTEYAALRSLLT
jgi:hypothetical protein